MKLWRSATEEEDSCSKVSLVFDKLKVDGKLYVWDTLRNCRVALSRSTASAQPEHLPYQSTQGATRKGTKK